MSNVERVSTFLDAQTVDGSNSVIVESVGYLQVGCAVRSHQMVKAASCQYGTPYCLRRKVNLFGASGMPKIRILGGGPPRF